MNGLVSTTYGIKRFLWRSNWLSCCYGLKIYTKYMYYSYPRSGFEIPLAFQPRFRYPLQRVCSRISLPIPHFEPSRSKPPLSILLRKLQRFWMRICMQFCGRSVFCTGMFHYMAFPKATKGGAVVGTKKRTVHHKSVLYSKRTVHNRTLYAHLVCTRISSVQKSR